MVDLEEFLKIFKEQSNIPPDKLIRFYRSIKRSVILSYAGKRGSMLLMKLCQNEQWPVLSKIDDPTLPIYHGADPDLLRKFIDTIKEQKKDNSWNKLQESTMKLAKLYESIFDFSDKEIERCAKMGKQYEANAIRQAYCAKLKLSAALGAGVVAAGAGVYVWKKKKDKK